MPKDVPSPGEGSSFSRPAGDESLRKNTQEEEDACEYEFLEEEAEVDDAESQQNVDNSTKDVVLDGTSTEAAQKSPREDICNYDIEFSGDEIVEGSVADGSADEHDTDDSDVAIHFNLNVSIKNFQSQKNGTDPFVMKIGVSSILDFHKAIWYECKDKLKREILFDTSSDILEWSPTNPQWQDRNRFFLFQDKSLKKVFQMDDVTMQLLQSWNDREIHLFCMAYSLSLKNLKDFKIAKTKLMTCKSKDRGGADSNQSLMQLVTELKERNKTKYRALETSYVLWANYIQDHPSYQQFDLVEEEPPKEYTHLFAKIESPQAGEQLEALRDDSLIAETVNDAMDAELRELREAFGVVKESVRKFDEKLINVQDRFKARRTVLSAVSKSVCEGEFSQSIAAKVVDCPDVDHADF